MGLHLVTGHSGNAHISAVDVANFNAGIFGSGTYVLPTGTQFQAVVESNNTVNISGGEMIIQGRHIRMPYAEVHPVSISNGTAGVNRADLIVIRYTNDFETGVENVEFAVIEGTETDGTPILPLYQTGDLLSGGCAIHEEPLYKIPINGLSIGEPEKLFDVFSPCGEIADNGVTYTRTLKLKRMFGEVEEVGGIFPSAYTIKDGENEDRTLGFTRIVDGSAESMLFFNKNGLGLFDAQNNKYSYFARIVKGTYTGDNAASRFINLGFKPSAVLVTRADGWIAGLPAGDSPVMHYCGGLATAGMRCSAWVSSKEYPVVEVVDSGFNVFHDTASETKTKIKTNTSGSTYIYIAVR